MVTRQDTLQFHEVPEHLSAGRLSILPPTERILSNFGGCLDCEFLHYIVLHGSRYFTGDMIGLKMMEKVAS